jgi:hypothetical protein
MIRAGSGHGVVMRPCMDCQTLIPNKQIRCDACAETKQARNTLRERMRVRERPHYEGGYRKRAKQVRDAAEVCWICNEPARPNDPWQADHVIPRDTDPETLLLPVHRSCNIYRSAKLIQMRKKAELNRRYMGENNNEK